MAADTIIGDGLVDSPYEALRKELAIIKQYWYDDVDPTYTEYKEDYLKVMYEEVD